MKNILLLIALTFSYISQSQEQFIADSLDKYVEREMKRWQTPGVAVTVVKNGKILVNKGYGVKKINSQEKVDENTLFQIASNSKAITGTSLALLQHYNKLNLNDKVTQYLPDFKLKDDYISREATIKDLLTHRLGFETFQGDFLHWGSNVSRKHIINNLVKLEPVKKFRYEFGYCNAAFVCAGEIIPAVTDTSWDDYVKYHFFEPCEMKRSSTTYSKIKEDKNAASAHCMLLNKISVIPYTNVDNLGPAGSINSCTNDMSNYMMMLLDSGRFKGKQVLPFSVIQNSRKAELTMNARYNPYYPSTHFKAYGLGWFLRDYEGKLIVEHTGGSNGFVTSVTLIPELNLGICVLTNSDYNDVFQSLRDQLVDAALNRPYRNHSAMEYEFQKPGIDQLNAYLSNLKSQVKKISLKEIEKYTGKYNNDFYGNLEIKVINNQMRLTLEHHPDLYATLESIGNEKYLASFNNPGWGMEVFTFYLENEKVKAIEVKVNDYIDYGTYKFNKIN